MKQGKFFLGVALIVGAVGYLIYTGIQETSTYYLTIDEFLPKREALANEGIRVAGRVQAGSIDWDPKTLHLNFVMEPFKPEGEVNNHGVPVRYQGILPDMFADGRDVIVEGQYRPGNALIAKTIMTSCPSKYEPVVDGQAKND